jgi:hypothetical protein
MLNVEAYRTQMRMMGEPVRCLKGFPCSCYNARTNSFDPDCTRCLQGVEFVEQDVAAYKVLIANLKKRYEHPEYGLLEVGELTICNMANELLLAFKDRIVLTGRRAVAREAVTRAASGPDTLIQDFPVSLMAVYFEGTSYTVGEDCTIEAGKVVWLPDGQAPAAGSIYAVEYHYSPVYWYLAQDETPPRPVPLLEGVVTPQRGFLVSKLPGGN